MLVVTKRRSQYKLYSEVRASPVAFLYPTHSRSSNEDTDTYVSVCYVRLSYCNPSFSDLDIRTTDWTKANFLYSLQESQ